jgi:hypothetical protein
MDVTMSSPLAKAGSNTDTGATVSYTKKGDKMNEKQISSICKKFLQSSGGRALLLEITRNIILLWMIKIKRFFRVKWGSLWGARRSGAKG